MKIDENRNLGTLFSESVIRNIILYLECLFRKINFTEKINFKFVKCLGY